MTSLPILFFALFDFEYEKGEEHSDDAELGEAAIMEEAEDVSEAQKKQKAVKDYATIDVVSQAAGQRFMTHPLLYRIGIER